VASTCPLFFYPIYPEGAKVDRQGMTLIEIMLVVSIIALIAAIALPAFTKVRRTAQQKACIQNLNQIDSAKEQAAMAYFLSQGAAIAEASVNSYLRSGAPACPGGGAYTYQPVGTDPTCSITDPKHAIQ
jgi:prepilin-type N-terminal cleavage/methylation domain-containing protein